MLFHKALKLASQLTFLAALVLIIASCGKEQLGNEIAPVNAVDNNKGLEDYPDEITIDNWEEFIYAPQSVIDHFGAKEAAQVQKTRPVMPEDRDFQDDRSAWIYADVIAYNGSWTGIGGVDVTIGGCTAFGSYAGPTPNYYLNNTCGSLPLCMAYAATPINGVSTYDLVLISRHILQINCFLSPREYLAADADRNGVIDQDDIDDIKDVILFNVPTFANCPVIRFIPEGDYNDLQYAITGCTIDPIALSLIGFTPDCLAPTNNESRRVIKTGDINGSFSF